MMNNCCGCNSQISDNLKRICCLQKEAVREELREETCSSTSLGCGRKDRFNTRPLQLFTNNDTPWHCPVNRSNTSCNQENRTCVFRVESMDNCCATFRCLVPVGAEELSLDENPCIPGRFLSTDSFITIKLDKISAMRCLNDCFVDICIR